MIPSVTSSEPFRASVLQCYLDHFDSSKQPLDEAFRNLCAKLFFKAESQQMDRIIEAFAKRYWDCNPTTLYHSAGKSPAAWRGSS
jgi:Sec7-like guanine-nucleotide exchange factor